MKKLSEIYRLDEADMDRFSDEEQSSGSPFGDFLHQRYPSGDVPWKDVEKILKKHGVPMPLMIGLGKEEAEEYGIVTGQPADVNKLIHFLGY